MAILTIRGLTKTFRSERQGWRAPRQTRAVDAVDLEVGTGQTLALIGESGSGKSTLARCIAGLLDVDEGSIQFQGRELVGLSQKALRPIRKELQVIFQDPIGSLNPKRRVGSIIEDVMAATNSGTARWRRQQALEVMERVGLSPEHYNRFPGDFSGGQRQRIAIARAIVTKPRLIICDEPVSSLDVSIQAQILNLLSDLQSEWGMSYVFITHDLSVALHMGDEIAVMKGGSVVERGATQTVWKRPEHPYTRELLSAAGVSRFESQKE